MMLRRILAGCLVLALSAGVLFAGGSSDKAPPGGGGGGVYHRPGMDQ
jgi:hypothetical protein